jgi:hypothetical protein
VEEEGAHTPYQKGQSVKRIRTLMRQPTMTRKYCTVSVFRLCKNG